MIPAAELAASLAPLTRRVRRDVTAVKGESGQRWTRETLNRVRLEAHVDGSGPSRGVSQINAGESTTRVAVLDFDSHEGETPWSEMVRVAMDVADGLRLIGGEPIAWRSSGGRGVHLYCIWDEPQDAYSVREWLKAALAGSGLKSGAGGVSKGAVEVFPKQDEVPADGFGNQVVLPLAGASVPLVWEPLVGEWAVGDRSDALRLDWPVSAPVPKVEHVARAVGRRDVDRESFDEAYLALIELLDAIPNSGATALDYDEWRNVIFAIHNETDGSSDGLQLAHEFSAKSDKYAPGFLDERVWPYVRSEGRGQVVGLGTLQHIAARYGWVSVPVSADVFDVIEDERPPLPSAGIREIWTPGAAEKAWPAIAHFPDAPPVAMNGNHAPELLPKPQAKPPAVLSPLPKRRGIPEAHHLTTDQANANRLVRAFGRMVFVAAGRWHVWDGRRWLADEADVYRYGCQLSDIIKTEAQDVIARAAVEDDAARAKAAAIAESLKKWAVRSEMKATIESAIGLARKMLTVEVETLDRDPFALNCLNGIVDLRTGRLRPHNPDEMITKLVPVRYVPDAACEAWVRVLGEICRGDRELAAYLQRWFGYCLTGSVVEQVFVVHWGSGANGKSTVLGLMAETLGEYAGTAAPGLLASGKGAEGRHPTEIASLMGKRMVTAHESGEGVVLREDFVKQATGDDRLEARFMRGDFFGFSPTHKLQLLTNHKPQVKGTDRGIWRRVQLVPYLAAFGTEEQVRAGTHTGVRDEWLMDRLRGELEGVLAWRVRGAVEWSSGGGLRPPGVVRSASEEYRSEQDRVGQFVGECCERDVDGAGWMEPLTDSGDLTGKGGLYPAFVGWCKEGGVFPMSKVRFVDEVLRVVGVGATVLRYSQDGNGKRRKAACVPGLRLLEP